MRQRRKNPGNLGHKGYKMSVVTKIDSDETHVLLYLACGHIQQQTPYPGTIPEEWARHIQEEPQGIVIGQNRFRCGGPHGQKEPSC